MITVGRSAKSDVVVGDAGVSRIHLQLVVTDDGTCYAVDMNSTNGTFVNGQRIAGRVRLRNGDVLRIGNMTLPWQGYVGPTPSASARKGSSLRAVAALLFVLLVAGAAVYVLSLGHAETSREPEPSQMERYESPAGEKPVIMSYKSRETTGRKEKPAEGSIPLDLVGHTLSESVSGGYRRSDWVYMIESTSVSGFRMDKVLEDNADNYVMEASFHLKGGKNFYYDTRAKIGYVNKGKGWELDYVLSLGMTVVSDGQYDACIACGIVDDGWGGVNCLSLSNTSEYPLAVGGQIRTGNGWQKFSLLVKAHDTGAVGGTFGGGNVDDYRIEFVVRE